MPVEIICKIGGVVSNYSKELSTLYSSQKQFDELKDEMVAFVSVWDFVIQKYQLEEMRNLNLFINWVKKMYDPSDIEAKSFHEVETLKSSYLSILYVIPALSGEEYNDQMFNINYLRNIFFTIPFMWTQQERILNMRDTTENSEKPYISNDYTV